MQIVLVLTLIVIVGLPAMLLPTTLFALARRAVSGEAAALFTTAGLGLGCLLHLGLRKFDPYRLFAAHQHELSHLLFSLAMGARPLRLQASLGGGSVEYRMAGSLLRARAFMVSIAPYWFSPLLTVPIAMMVFSDASGWLHGLVIAALTAWALALSLSQISLRQTDLRRHSTVPPIAAALWLWSATTVGLLAALGGSDGGALLDLYSRAWRLSCF